MKCRRDAGGPRKLLLRAPRLDGGVELGHRVGLDHLSFHCASRSELDTWSARLDELGYAHGRIEDAPYGSGLSFRDPDGNALEFFAAPGT